MRTHRTDLGSLDEIVDPARYTGPVGRTPEPHDHRDAVDIISVRFARGARTVPHTHSADQVLYAESGSGLVQTHDRSIELRPGDWAIIPAGTVHWHGASDTDEFVQVALKFGGTTDWSPSDGAVSL